VLQQIARERSPDGRQVPVAIVNGVQYYEFRVDLNESNSNPDGQISLDQFKIYTSANGGIEDTATLFSQGNLVYNMG